MKFSLDMIPPLIKLIVTIGAGIAAIAAALKNLQKIQAALRAFWSYLVKTFTTREMQRKNLELLQQLSKRVEDIYAETKTNGGATIKDALNRIESRQRVRFYEDPQPSFEADQAGEFTWSNRAFIELTGRLPNEICGSGWINIVSHIDRERIGQAWQEAISDERDFEEDFAIIADRKEIQISCRAVRMVDGMQRVLGYWGTFTIK